jgi:hypothetical protein
MAPSPSRFRLALLLLLRWAMAALFAWTAYLKLEAPDATQMAFFQYRLVSWETAGVLSVLVPMLELSAALGLLVPRLRLGGISLSIGLLLVFCAALASALARHLDISCGCYGTNGAHVPAIRRLLEDIVLLGFCWILWKKSSLHFHQDSECYSFPRDPQNR